MKSLTKRTLLKLGVFLLLGAIVNVAVAWGCASHGQPRGSRFDAAKNMISMPRHGDPTPISEKEVDWLIAHGWTEGQASDVRSARFRSETSRTLGTIALWYHTPVESLNQPFASVARFQSGWPSRSVESVYVKPMFSLVEEDQYWDRWVRSGSNRRADAPWHSGTWIIGSDSRDVIGSVVLPLFPLWPGFAINTIFYAALLWVLWIAPRGAGKIRRFVRVRGHRCPACGYKIDSAPGIGPRCSECGAELPERVRTQHI